MFFFGLLKERASSILVSTIPYNYILLRPSLQTFPGNPFFHEILSAIKKPSFLFMESNSFYHAIRGYRSGGEKLQLKIQ